MKKKRFSALLLTAVMVFYAPVFAFADADNGNIGNTGAIEGTKTEEAASNQENVNKEEENKNEESDPTGQTAAAVASTAATTQNVSSDEWVPSDFTYTDMEQTLYGCDYSRQFNIEGKAISGFSESGTVKLANNKDLVIPATDTDGNKIVGIANNAFYKKGLESVTFPTGMMTSYNDTVTNRVTKRGNFIIGSAAFANNNLTSVHLPEGVIAVMSNAFMNNKITTVTFPKTIWWLETLAFAKNEISKLNFPQTCDFQLEMHGMTFYGNKIKSVRLPDFTEVVNKAVFSNNPGMEKCSADAPDKEKKLGGVVYMYTDNAELEFKDRIHTVEKTTESTKSWHQKLIVNDGTAETQNPDTENWNINDFTVEGTVVTGLSASGIKKRATNKDLVIPDKNANGEYITAIASATGSYGLFGAEGEGFDSVALPNQLEKIGDKAFANNGIKDVSFPAELQEIGMGAFMMNSLSSVVLPDTVTKLGNGAFSTNPKLERISLSSGLTEIPDGAFGCSDAKNWMEKLTSIEIPDTITKIGKNAFAGNNFSKIVIPSSVKSIGDYAFSTKNYLKTPCILELSEGLETIGKYAFRNKVISDVTLPTTVKSLPKNAFQKEYSDSTTAVVTKVKVSLGSQYEDKTNFPASDYHKLYLTDTGVWTADDFTYGEMTQDLYPASDSSDKLKCSIWAVTGFSEQGEEKLNKNKNVVIPTKDPNGKAVNGVGNSAFAKKGIENVTFPAGVTTSYSGNWSNGVTERGNFFIGAGAFSGNELKSVDIPEGVIYIGSSAFKSNQLTSVKIPKSAMMITSQAFANNSIAAVDFPEKTDFPLQIDNMAFAVNKIKSVQIPANTDKLSKYVFFQNTGEEPITDGNVNENKGGLVYVYKADATGAYLEDTTNGKSKVQKLIIGTIPAEQAPWGISDFTYDEAGITITGLSDTGKEKIKSNSDVKLPDVGPTGKDITAIGDGATGAGTFGYKDSDGTLYVPDGITLSAKLQTIGKFAFTQSKFTSIKLPNTLTEIGMTAFSNSKLTSVVIPDSVVTIGSGAFSNSTNLATVVLSKSLTTIPASAFTMTAIKDIEIPEGVASIGSRAFAGTHAEAVSLPSTLTDIGTYAFQNNQFKEVSIPKNVKKIGTSAFEIYQEGYNATLTKLTLPEGLESIGSKAFAKSDLVTVEIPGSLTTLHKDAFKDSTSNVKLKTADKNQLTATKLFISNGSRHTVVYDALTGTGWTEEDFTYSNDGTILTGWSASGQIKRLTNKKLVLPDTAPDGTEIKGIGEAAFKIPDDEITIMKFNVESLNGMESVVLPKNLKVIGKQAFEYNNFTEVPLADGLTTIGESAFHGNMLTKVEIPDSVSDMGMGAFAMNNITELKLSKSVTVIPQSAFSMNIRMESITIPDTVTEIGQMAFAGARLTSLTIPASVTKIGTKAFHLHRLTELTIPGTVKEIGESAFEGTYKAQTLKSLMLGDGIEKIGKYAFKEGLLKEVKLPYSLKELGEEPFLNNTGATAGHVVTLTTLNTDHLDFAPAKTHKIVFVGHNNMVKGNGSKWIRSNGGALQFKADGELKDFRSIAVTGTNYSLKLDKDAYIVKGDAINITLNEDYIKTLADGTYSLSIIAKSGTAKATFIVQSKADSGNVSGGSNTHATTATTVTRYASAGSIAPTVSGSQSVIGGVADNGGDSDSVGATITKNASPKSTGDDSSWFSENMWLVLAAATAAVALAIIILLFARSRKEKKDEN